MLTQPLENSLKRWVLWPILEQLDSVCMARVQGSGQDCTFLVHWMEGPGKNCFPVHVVFHYLRAVICIKISDQISLDPCFKFEIDKKHPLVNTPRPFLISSCPTSHCGNKPGSLGAPGRDTVCTEMNDMIFQGASGTHRGLADI